MRFLTIIVTYNAMAWIERCIKSLEASTTPLDVCIVDNMSKDDTVHYLKSNYSFSYFYESTKNLGFGQANNVGFRYAIEQKYDYVILLNQDAYLDADAIEKLLPYLDEKNIFSPVHLNGDGTMIDRNFKKSSILNDCSKLVDDAILKKIDGVYTVPSVNAACWILSVNLLKKIGGFNPLFFHYGEDTNFAHRLKYYGGEFKVLPLTFVRHDREQYGNIKAYNTDVVYRKLLLTSANINLSVKSIIKGCFADCVVDIHKNGLRIVLSYLKTFVRLLCLCRKKIAESRKTEINNCAWL